MIRSGLGVFGFIRICKDRLKTSPHFQKIKLFGETRVVWESLAKGRRGGEAGHIVDRGTRDRRPQFELRSSQGGMRI